MSPNDARPYIDAEHPEIRAFAAAHAVAGDPRATAVALFHAVRDALPYNPYAISLDPADHRASAVLAAGQGFCVSKAVVLAACLRAAGLNARIGFADVRNHQSTPKLLALMQTDVFRYHGYTEVEIDGRWHKLTPAFNRELCERFGVRPLDWDGNGDALFHEFDLAGEQHMEYLADHGPREDLPFEEMMNAYRRHYPGLFEAAARGRAAPDDAFRTPANH